jgi:hypothetical protein
LLTCNQAEYASLPPGQIVPALADQGLYIGSESSFYRVLHAHGQVNRRARARPPQEPKAVPRLWAIAPNQLWSWDITYLPTTVRGIWLYLYLVIDVWSRKVVAWQGRLKVRPCSPWRGCRHWVSSAGLTASDARNRLRCS